MIHALLVMLCLGGLMHAARSFLPPDADGHAISGTALSFGFLLLLAFFAGKALGALRLPRLTGYILAGVVTGPSVLDLVSRDMVRALGPIQGVAICLIALAAGGELNFAKMRPLLRTVRSMMLWAVAGSAAICTGTLMLLARWLPFLDGLSLGQSFAVAAVVGVSLAAMSPAVVMALLSEKRAEGPLSRTMLGAVVVADLVVILLFALVASVAQALLGGSVSLADAALHVTWEVLGSAVAGIAIGMILAVFLRKVREGVALFVLLICVVVSEVGSRLALDPLIVALTAGLFMENVAEVETTELIHQIEAASLPVYVVFFAVAGAALRLDVLATIIAPAVVLVLVRSLAIGVGSRIAVARTGADVVVRRWAFAGMLPQAGLALALPLLYPKILGDRAESSAALVLGIVGINQVVMPVLLRIALVRSGETDRAARQGELTKSAPAPETRPA
jgi:Kef-type K+ transport system membrane component KefB